MSRESLPQQRDGAACRDVSVDPEVFFPISESDVKTIDYARSICATCPLMAICAEYALANPRRAEFGVWGGITEWQRRSAQRAEARRRARLSQAEITVAASSCIDQFAKGA